MQTLQGKFKTAGSFRDSWVWGSTKFEYRTDPFSFSNRKIPIEKTIRDFFLRSNKKYRCQSRPKEKISKLQFRRRTSCNIERTQYEQHFANSRQSDCQIRYKGQNLWILATISLSLMESDRLTHWWKNKAGKVEEFLVWISSHVRTNFGQPRL